MKDQFITKLLQVLAEGKRRFVALPLERQWFGSLVGFVIGFIFFASVLRFNPQNLIHLPYLLLLVCAYIGVILLVGMAYKWWQGKCFDRHKIFPRTLLFFGHLAVWGGVLAAAFYDAIVYIYFKG